MAQQAYCDLQRLTRGNAVDWTWCSRARTCHLHGFRVDRSITQVRCTGAPDLAPRCLFVRYVMTSDSLPPNTVPAIDHFYYKDDRKTCLYFRKATLHYYSPRHGGTFPVHMDESFFPVASVIYGDIPAIQLLSLDPKGAAVDNVLLIGNSIVPHKTSYATT